MTRLNPHFNPYQRAAYERQMRRLNRPVLSATPRAPVPPPSEEAEEEPPPAA